MKGVITRLRLSHKCLLEHKCLEDVLQGEGAGGEQQGNDHAGGQ